MGHYATQCPLRNKDKDEKHDPQARAAKIEGEEFVVIVCIPPGERWVDLELYMLICGSIECVITLNFSNLFLIGSS